MLFWFRCVRTKTYFDQIQSTSPFILIVEQQQNKNKTRVHTS